MLRAGKGFVVLMPVKVLGAPIKTMSMMEVSMCIELFDVRTHTCLTYEIVAMRTVTELVRVYISTYGINVATEFSHWHSVA
jgi:hypothetical protein